MALTHVTGPQAGDASEVQMVGGADGRGNQLVDVDPALLAVRSSTEALVLRSADPIGATLEVLKAGMPSEEEQPGLGAELEGMADLWIKFRDAVRTVEADETLTDIGKRERIAALVDKVAEFAGQMREDVERSMAMAAEAEYAAAWPVLNRKPSAADLVDRQFVFDNLKLLPEATRGQMFIEAAGLPDAQRTPRQRNLVDAVKHSLDLGYPIVSEPWLGIGKDALVKSNGMSERVNLERQRATWLGSFAGSVEVAISKTVDRYGLAAEWHAGLTRRNG